MTRSFVLLQSFIPDKIIHNLNPPKAPLVGAFPFKCFKHSLPTILRYGVPTGKKILIKKTSIKLNGLHVGSAEKSTAGIYQIRLGQNCYADETLDRIVKHLSALGQVVLITESTARPLPRISSEQMQKNLNAASAA